MLRFYHEGDSHLHDPLTIAWLLRPDLFTGRRAAIRVETSGRAQRRDGLRLARGRPLPRPAAGR